MKTAIIIIFSLIMAIVVYGAYSWLQNRDTTISPVPEEGIKVIQISP